MKAPAVGEGRGIWAEWLVSSNRIIRASAALWGKCLECGFRGLFGGIPEVQGMLGEDPGRP